MPTLVEKVPLVQDTSGDIRVEGSRVFLEHIVEKFKEGKSPEEISVDFPSLDLVDIYSVVTYYLRHQDEVDSYVASQRAQAQETRLRLSQYQSSTIQERLKLRSTK